MRDLTDHDNVAWEALPDHLKRAAVNHLREHSAPSFLAYVNKEGARKGLGNWFPYSWWHFDGGMAVRNCLREIIKDDELPGLSDSCGCGNWDDYYVVCVEAAAGLRDV